MGLGRLGASPRNLVWADDPAPPAIARAKATACRSTPSAISTSADRGASLSPLAQKQTPQRPRQITAAPSGLMKPTEIDEVVVPGRRHCGCGASNCNASGIGLARNEVD